MTSEIRPEQYERELIDQICRGQTEHFYTLIKPYERHIFAIAYAVLGNAADAEDAAQETFLNALRALKGFRADSRFSTWLFQIALNEARTRLRRSRAHLHQSLDESNESEDNNFIPRDLADWREIPSEALARKELRQIVEATLRSMRPIYREVITLRDIQNLDTAETAQILGISEDRVKTRLRRARLQMREALAPGYDGSWRSGSKVYNSTRPW